MFGLLLWAWASSKNGEGRDGSLRGPQEDRVVPSQRVILFSRLTQSVAWAPGLSCPHCPPCGVWGLCPFLFLLSSTPMLPALDLHPPSRRPRQTCLPPASECQSPLQYRLHSLNFKPNSASCQVIWWQWWTLGCPMVLNFSKPSAFFTSVTFSWKGSAVGEITWR